MAYKKIKYHPQCRGIQDRAGSSDGKTEAWIDEGIVSRPTGIMDSFSRADGRLGESP